MAGESIVVVDSESMVRTVVGVVLEDAGYRVRTTGDFEAGLEMVRSDAPDLLITNVFLRGISGHDAILRLRGEFPDMRIMMASGIPDSQDVQRWMREERFDAFPKPFTADALRRKVKQLLRRKKSAGEERKARRSHSPRTSGAG